MSKYITFFSLLLFFVILSVYAGLSLIKEGMGSSTIQPVTTDVAGPGLVSNSTPTTDTIVISNNTNKLQNANSNGVISWQNLFANANPGFYLNKNMAANNMQGLSKSFLQNQTNILGNPSTIDENTQTKPNNTSIGSNTGRYNNDIPKYNSDNLDITYHGNLQAAGTDGVYNTSMGTANVYDVNGKLIDIISNGVQGNIVYYQPGSYKYGATSYVPYYEDSVFLSRSAKAIVNAPKYVSTSQNTGMCNFYKNDPNQLEQQCNAINGNVCAATSCCVLLGGQKCVSGDEAGPKMKSNYSDYLVANKDFYYYQGKCYGNCPYTSPQLPTPSLPEKIPYMPPPPADMISPASYTPSIPSGTKMPPLVTSIPPPPPSMKL
jgi:hypothetical protein